ncbi:MAG TPA: pectin acetylesterase-family hydrolase [Polyangiaceae bacterium]|nr:pectin acetylesterase-family hydrolase [Polyangiaceae bacterium]
MINTSNFLFAITAILGGATLVSACGSDSTNGNAGTGGFGDVPFGGVAGSLAAGGSVAAAAGGTPAVVGGGGAAPVGMGGTPIVGGGGTPNAGGTPVGAGGTAAGGAGGAAGASAGGTAGMGGVAGAAGVGGMTPLFPPFPTNGMPITAPDNTWTYLDFPDTKCRDGTPAGLAVSLNSASTKVMLFLQGGGACFDSLTCGLNPANTSTQKAAVTTGLFNRNNAANPVKDWNYVFVPYCTGDTYLGTNDNGMISGVTGVQHFMGRKNLESFLNRIVPTFPKATQVLLTGVSAGGFGAASSSYLVQRAFGDVPVTMLDDSGPPMSTMVIPECLQEKWRTTWGLDGSILADCGSACPNQNDYTIDYTKFVLKLSDMRSGNAKSGLIDSNDDNTITLFYGYGQNNCTGSLATPVPKAQYDAGLLEFRSIVTGLTPNFGTYYPNSTQHTWLLDDSTLYSEAEGGTKLIDWITALVNGTGVSQVGM